MKKILLIITLIASLMACQNQDIDYPDFDYSTGYFPYQYPVRTLVLGDYIYDNTNDNNHKFLISAAIGGLYENKKDRVFEIQLAPELCAKALFESTRDTIRLMPSNYYKLNSNNITVPAGKVNGGVEVQLSDAFFDDPLAIKMSYVIPIRLIGSADVDTVLQGKSSKNNPDPRIASQWDIQPKNFTMFAVNFINPYHGMYLHRGVNTIKNAAGSIVETNVYRTRYVVDNEVWKLSTTGKNQVNVTGSTHSSLVPGQLSMNLIFSSDGKCTIIPVPGSTYSVSGNGKFVTGGDTWGDKKRDVIHINYQLTLGANTYSATDTLVIRDRAVKMQVYKPVVF